ncbi:4-hydroxythreonine-4-phosphate dehydrogenase [Mycolicibacterium sp. 018/SC-01/001]|uniref:four-carbon acid sugar kinase family protein n=1 Tax=Mycolicibacterium sp. 018/SC-01/001 TaxID=2592069 RepID=UPI00117D3705|nr:four-carbon acid sugar kinase family protein [Mycolicibacterium sp. 018/SC-01/001]TRW87965.1 4-hydroxythreonine-4-phosphate dehydrogenase [Mycolicibacterium sp. 018/SC-01/001]
MSGPADLTILADDLSGAAETAAAFLDREPPPTLALHPGDADRPGVTVVDLNSRTLPEAEADRTLRTALDALPPDRPVMYKIDSLLRGHIGAAVDQLARRGPVLLAAGLPALRRSVCDGVPYVDGVALHRTDLWHWEAAAPPRTVAELLRSPARDGLSAVHIPAALASGAVAVCDVASDADLDAAVRVALSVSGVQFVGTSALAAALARTLPAASVADPARAGDGRNRGALVVVGTAAGSAAEQVGALREQGAVQHVLDTSDLLAGHTDPGDLAALLTDRPVVVVTLRGSSHPEHRRALAGALGRLVAAADHGSDLVLTGGETARAVIDALGVRSLLPVDVVHHGAVVSETPDGRRIVTRPGSFGERNSLVDAVTHLASAQRQTHFTATTLRNQS